MNETHQPEQQIQAGEVQRTGRMPSGLEETPLMPPEGMPTPEATRMARIREFPGKAIHVIGHAMSGIIEKIHIKQGLEAINKRREGTKKVLGTVGLLGMSLTVKKAFKHRSGKHDGHAKQRTLVPAFIADRK